MFKKPSAILVFSACFFASVSGAQTTDSFPEMRVDNATLRVQEQAEEVYNRTDYERAFRIYRYELVPIGDKWAQYNVGFMYLTGKGVEEDRVTASAWYRLAAERDTKEFVQARDQVLRSLDEAQLAESDRIFIELRKEFGDLVLITKAIRDDYEELGRRTGSRLNSSSTAATVMEFDVGGNARSGDYYQRLQRRIEKRLAYLAEHTSIEIIDIDTVDVGRVDIDEIERQVEEQVSRLP